MTTQKHKVMNDCEKSMRASHETQNTVDTLSENIAKLLNYYPPKLVSLCPL